MAEKEKKPPTLEEIVKRQIIRYRRWLERWDKKCKEIRDLREQHFKIPEIAEIAKVRHIEVIRCLFGPISSLIEAELKRLKEYG